MSSSQQKTENKVVVVTGATQGIGKAITETLLQAGFRVVINSRNIDRINSALEQMSRFSTQLTGVSADIRLSSGVDVLIEQAKKRFGHIDILINNAGIAIFSPITDTSEKDWENMYQTNLKSVFLSAKAVLPDMLSRKTGHIITILSVAAKKAFQNCSAYAASKAGALAFMNVLREEVRHSNILVTSILAGATDTPLWDSISGDFPRDKMITTKAIADSVLAAIQNPDGMVEEIQIRPIGGDL